MSTHHASPGEIVNLATWANDLPREQSKAIAKTDDMELARLVLEDGENIENKHVEGPLVVQCLSGCLEVRAMGTTQRMGGGEMMYLPPGETFTLQGVRQALVLVTFVFVG